MLKTAENCDQKQQGKALDPGKALSASWNVFYLFFDSLSRALLLWLWNMRSVVWPRGWRCACFCALFILVLVLWHYTIDCALWGVAWEKCEVIWAARGLRQSLVKRCRPGASERSLTGLSTRDAVICNKTCLQAERTWTIPEIHPWLFQVQFTGI